VYPIEYLELLLFLSWTPLAVCRPEAIGRRACSEVAAEEIGSAALQGSEHAHAYDSPRATNQIRIALKCGRSRFFGLRPQNDTVGYTFAGMALMVKIIFIGVYPARSFQPFFVESNIPPHLI
jgi:hypothetical protein